MKKYFLLIISGTLILKLSAQNGEEHFKTVCASCHTIGKGLLVGPDLKGAHKKHTEKWLVKWIKSSQTMVNEGDKKAVELFNQYNMIPMPDNPQFSDADVKAIITYIKTESGDLEEKVAAAGKTENNDSPNAPSTNKSSENNTADNSVGVVSVQNTINNNELSGVISTSGASGSNEMVENGPGNTFLLLGVGLGILFFLTVLAILARSVIVLSNELKISYKDNPDK